jgi:hypothetical protein
MHSDRQRGGSTSSTRMGHAQPASQKRSENKTIERVYAEPGLRLGPRLSRGSPQTIPSKSPSVTGRLRCSENGYQQTKPPSTIRSMPVTNDAARLARKTAGPIISSGMAMRAIGVSRSKILTWSATSGRRFMGVSV